MTPTIRQIQERTAEICGVSLTDMLSERRNGDICQARHLAMYAARLMTPKSLPAIGRAFDRDHTTVMFAINKIDWLVHRELGKENNLIGKVRSICSGWARGLAQKPPQSGVDAPTAAEGADPFISVHDEISGPGDRRMDQETPRTKS